MGPVSHCDVLGPIPDLMTPAVMRGSCPLQGNEDQGDLDSDR